VEGAYNVIVSNKLSIGALYCQWNFGTVLISQRPQNCSNQSAFDVFPGTIQTCQETYSPSIGPKYYSAFRSYPWI
jgi:hypothetical protein